MESEAVEEKADKVVVTLKPRPLVRLGRQLILHVNIISILCYVAGVVGILILPFLAKNTYISENALMPGSAHSAFNNFDSIYARSSAEELLELASQNPDVQRTISRWIIQEMLGVGADCYIHPFNSPAPAFSSTRFPKSSGHFKWTTAANSSFSEDEGQQQTTSGVNVVGIIRAPQGAGNEAVVLVTPYDSAAFEQESAWTLGMGVALFRELSQALWLARDVVWLVADSKYGAYPAVDSWLKEYHSPSISQTSTYDKMTLDWLEKILSEDGQSSKEVIHSQTLGDFKRAGTIASGLVYELNLGLRQGGKDTFTVWAEGPNGQMPNLDFINIVNSIAVYRESLQLRLETLHGIKNWAWLRGAGVSLEEIGKYARSVNPGWNFAMAASVYVDNMATLFSSMFFQVIGLPTGAHGAFRDYQIDAITLQFTVTKNGQDYLFSRIGRLLEGVLRSVNNLLEKWHQSFFLYFLSSPNRYISVLVYMIPLGLLLLGLPLQAAALCYPVKQTSKDAKDLAHSNLTSDGSGGWLEALVLVGAVQLWAFFSTLALFLISDMDSTAETKLLTWSVILVFSLMATFRVQRALAASINDESKGSGGNQNWATVKAVTIGFTCIGLAVMSTVNFPVSLIGALALVPMCIGVFPVERSWRYAQSQGRSALGVAALALGTLWTLAVSPLGLPVMLWSLYGHLLDITPGNVWNFAESLLQWRSALLPYLLVIHLPCSVLCLYILLSRLPTQRRRQ
ncbi:hypothetical protein R1sor_025743 [Riccia sorocarpa]|uniref:Glycosylphosphatidylinositol anchor attachment 1 protein n=1 Tax=Riccia sorocarpa TaxID=122646 RepID=A0ABD3G9I9_9MARC